MRTDKTRSGRFKTTAYSDFHLMLMIASQLNENDVVIAISRTGDTCEKVDAVNTSRANKAKIISINDNGSPLSQCSDLSISKWPL